MMTITYNVSVSIIFIFYLQLSAIVLQRRFIIIIITASISNGDLT